MNFKHPVHDADKLQAKQKTNHWCEIKPVQEKMWNNIFKSALLFFYKSTTKTKPVPESL